MIAQESHEEPPFMRPRRIDLRNIYDAQHFRCTVRKWRRSRPLRRRGRSTEERALRLSMRNDLLLTHPGLFPDAVRREVS